jgi:excinuclease ABC subunit C
MSDNSNLAKIKQKLSVLPDKPGCYLMLDETGKVIYVGKAKSLRSRVRSYFSGSHDTKTTRLVSKIADYEYIITDTNIEALILENNLIKKYRPRYNVMLKDDKTYPYIKLTADEHPRLEIVRKIKKDKAKYFGPYPNAGAAKVVKQLLDRIYPLRKCKTLKKEVCLYYHIGQCLGPCEFPVSAEENARMVAEITQFLQGDYQQIKQQLVAKMLEASEAMEYERANEIKGQLADIESIMTKQIITLNDRVDRDIIGYYADKGWLAVQIFFMRQGNLLESDLKIFPYYMEEEDSFLSFLTQYYFEHPVLAKEVLLPIGVDAEAFSEWIPAKVLQPLRGPKRKLVNLASKNAENALKEKFLLEERKDERTKTAIVKLAQALDLDSLQRIEAFDNSNIQGANPVSAMVVFIDGLPDRNSYRKFRIKSVVGPDDYETMREVIRRRYSRVLIEGLNLPDLIIVDGGLGQINAALDVLENELSLDIPVAGLRKDDKHRTSQLLLGSEARVIELARNSQEFYLLQRIQDEVHRFAITFHRQVRSDSMFKSELDGIVGVGPKRKALLLKHFRSVAGIRDAKPEEMVKLGINEQLAFNILEHLNKED